MSILVSKRCVNCPTGAPALTSEQQAALGREVPDWINLSGSRIQREYRFKSYMDGITWVQQAGAIADGEDHHPDIVVRYRKVLVEVWTHTVNGLSENDYILAAKLDASYDAFPGKR
jgi:4a-hydroxytetrahydrobiopterin dehydratase